MHHLSQQTGAASSCRLRACHSLCTMHGSAPRYARMYWQYASITGTRLQARSSKRNSSPSRSGRPRLVLSARDREDKVAALDASADDYLIKLFGGKR